MEWNKNIRNRARQPIPEEVLLEVFKPKWSILEIIEDYGEVLDDAYRKKWKKKE